MSKPIRILLVRHGESEGNVDPAAYLKGDHQVHLSQQGWKQAVALGKFLQEYYAESQTAEWPTTFVSSYMRPKETYAGIYHSIKDHFHGDPVLRENIFLSERFFGAANHLHHPPEHLSDFDKKVWKALLHLSKEVYSADPFKAFNLFGESPFYTLGSVKSFMDGTLSHARQRGKNDFLIVCHGAVIQSFLMNWGHIQMADKSRLGNPGNCDAIKIEGADRNWTFEKIWDGEEMERCNQDALKGLKPFSIRDIPSIPPEYLPS